MRENVRYACALCWNVRTTRQRAKYAGAIAHSRKTDVPTEWNSDIRRWRGSRHERQWICGSSNDLVHPIVLWVVAKWYKVNTTATTTGRGRWCVTRRNADCIPRHSGWVEQTSTHVNIEQTWKRIHVATVNLAMIAMDRTVTQSIYERAGSPTDSYTGASWWDSRG